LEVIRRPVREVVSHAGLALLRHLADKTGLTGGLSRALATRTDLGPWTGGRVNWPKPWRSAIADGARVISDFRVMRDQAGAVRAGWRRWADDVADAEGDRPRPGAGQNKRDDGRGERGARRARVGAGHRAARGAAGSAAWRNRMLDGVDLHPAGCDP